MMLVISKTEKMLVLGLAGLLITLATAYLKPSILQSTSLSDISLDGVIGKTGALLSIIGLLGFIPSNARTYKALLPNILRVTYVVLFIATSYCSENDWNCFN